MPARQQQKRLKAAILSFWLLLGYIIAALVWWYITLEQQNNEIAIVKNSLPQPALVSDSAFAAEKQKILSLRNRRSVKYAGEGAAFLVIILLGAVYVYRGVERQLSLGRQQQDFLMAVTHELKTPLAIGRLNIETLQKRKLSEEQQQKLLQNTLAEMQRLNDLTTNILVVSQLDAGEYKHNSETLNLSSLVQQVAAGFQKQYPEKEIILEIAPDIFTQGDVLLLKLVASNLLSNAIKYAGHGKPITINLSGTQKPVLTVIDNGPGIADAEKTKIFNKFYRTENENTRNTQGTGLGLYLCKRILNAHGAEIRVTDNTPTGSRFTVTFR